MTRLKQWCVFVFMLSLGGNLHTVAQQTNSNSAAALMPRLIRFAGTLAIGDSSQRVAGITARRRIEPPQRSTSKSVPPPVLDSHHQ